jgi:amidase
MRRRQFLGTAAAALGTALVRPGVSRAAASDLDFVSVVSVARAIRQGEVSSVEVTTRMLDRIQRFNPQLNAIVTVTADRALARARTADQARSRGESWGPLHGVPCTIKDALATAGVRTTGGSPAFADHVPARDATNVARDFAAGAIMLGKTNLPVNSADWQSFNPIFGTANNPYDLKRTPGGSTGGDAAAVAAGLAYFALGGDFGGSIRIPADFCGLYGHKGTLNIVPAAGYIPPAPGTPTVLPEIAVQGPLTRTAGDLRALLEVMVGPEGDDAKAYRVHLPAPRGVRLSDYRIGFVLDDSTFRVSPEVSEQLARAVEALRKAGATVQEGWPTGVKPVEQYETYAYLNAASRGAAMSDGELEALRKVARRDGSFEEKRAFAATAPYKYYVAATRQRMAARAVWQDYFRTHDAFLMPNAVVPAFPHDHSEPRFSRILKTPIGPRPYSDLMYWIAFASVTGLPATTAPVGFTKDGIPVGVQILGPYMEDLTPIDIAARLADVIGGFTAPKGYGAS